MTENPGESTSFELAALSAAIPSAASQAKRATTGKYRRKLKDYAVSLISAGMPQTKDPERKLKEWIRAGRHNRAGTAREPVDLPPFDEMHELAPWWRRCMTYKVPDYLIELEKADAEKGGKAAATKPAAPSSPKPTTDAEEVQIEYGDVTFDETVAGDIGVKVARSFVVDGLRRFKEARQTQNLKQARIIRDELRDDIEDLRRQETSALKLLEGRGEYLRAKELMTEANRIFSILSISFFNAMELAIKRAAPSYPAPLRRDLAQELRDSTFEHLQTTRFSESWQPIDDAP